MSLSLRIACLLGVMAWPCMTIAAEVEQNPSGPCSPAINGSGNTVNCSGVDPRAMARLEELLDMKDRDLKQKIVDANEWARKYNELNAQLIEARHRLAAKGETTTPVLAAQDLLHQGKLEEARLVYDILTKVIARDTRRYTDLLPLDGGTVGIANFSTGGLAFLYREMDTEKYFGRSVDEMISNYSGRCRPVGKHGNDTDWGCYSKTWWRDGMTRFVGSPESVEAQNRAWAAAMRPAIDAAFAKGWTDPRSLAIALSVANSLGSFGFLSLTTEHNWRPEEVLSAYVGDNAHRARRRDALNATFPPRQ